MKIVIPCEGNGGLEDGVATHFGRCPSFTVVEIELKSKEIKKVETVKNPYYEQHMPFAVPEFISTMKPDLVICGGAGQRAIQALEGYKIDLIYGCTGKVEDIINDFLNDRLQGTRNLCEHI